MSRIEGLKALEKAATQGVFRCSIEDERVLIEENGLVGTLAEVNSPEDCRLFVAARNALPALIEIAEHATEIACSVPDDIPGLNYLKVQIQRSDWAKLKAALEKLENT